MAELSDKVVEFLSAGTRTRMLGYVAADDRPLVVPVRFVVDDGQLVFNTGRDTSKGRALARDSRVVICVCGRLGTPTRPIRSCRQRVGRNRGDGDGGSAGHAGPLCM
jgi:nitroimidazol reductase NimA-like FMN-containing flavoprotein (pyridoxamine 5'-phosphate oxidase superfamily)